MSEEEKEEITVRISGEDQVEPSPSTKDESPFEDHEMESISEQEHRITKEGSGGLSMNDVPPKLSSA